MTRLLCFTMVCGLAATPGSADEYWVSYQGNDFPENEGWERTFSDKNGVFGQGGAIRTFENGALVLDARGGTLITDFYQMFRQIDPDPGELFIMRWRLKIDLVPKRFGVSAGVFSDTSRGVGFQFGESTVRSAFERNVDATFEPQEFHVFELTSSDMEHYEFSIDGSPACSGNFMPAGPPSRAGWGDGTQGPISLSRWDYFEFGVVPEPSTLLSIVCASLAIFGRRRTINMIKE